jgi:DNA-binding NarL/FixJ family response regulator
MITVLIVDDHPLIRQGLSTALSNASDIKVIGEAQDADEALAKARSERPNIILLDISLPGKNGLEVLKQLHLEMPEIQVLILSTFPEKQYAVRCLKNGAAGYLTKRSRNDELLIAIRTIMRRGRYVNPALAELLVSEIGGRSEKIPHEKLSDREFQVLCLIGQGKKVSEISEILSISIPTVSTHRAHVLEKMNMKSTAELIQYVLTNNLVEKIE